MEMEYINENLIRVYIETGDLIERGISFLDLMSDQEEVEKFFMTILQEVDVSNEFKDTEAITFQVLPKKNGFDLYISKAQDENGEFHLDALEKIISEDQKRQKRTSKGSMDSSDTDMLSQLSDRLNDEKKRSIKDDMREYAFHFASFTDVVQFAKDFTFEAFKTSLYHYKNEYYLTLKADHLSPEDMTEALKDLVMMFEFSTFANYSVLFLEEHADCLIESNADKIINQYFTK